MKKNFNCMHSPTAKKSFVRILLLILFASSCTNYSFSQRFNAISNAKFELPDYLLKFDKGKISRFKCDTLPIMIHLVTNDDCSLCAITHMLDDNIAIYDLADSIGGFIPMVIMTPSETLSETEIIDLLKLYHFPIPVYIDENATLSSTGTIPRDVSLHYFLLSTNGDVCFVGNPTSTSKMKKLFMEAVDSLNSTIIHQQ